MYNYIYIYILQGIDVQDEFLDTLNEMKETHPHFTAEYDIIPMKKLRVDIAIYYYIMYIHIIFYTIIRMCNITNTWVILIIYI